MNKLKITAKELRSIGYPSSPVIPIAMEVIMKEYKHTSHNDALMLLAAVLENPEKFYANEHLVRIADKLKPIIFEDPTKVKLNEQAIEYETYGSDYIDEQAKLQMNQAVRLPIAVAGALMPDAHSGYGLPIGGVLATRNAIIPYGVGVDIGCRMCLSIFNIEAKDLISNDKYYTKILDENTLFGSGRSFKNNYEHAIISHESFQATSILRSLKGRAVSQLGTSGSGNHFVEFGRVDIEHEPNELQLPIGHYVALLSHSGSRGLGATIAQHYTDIAKQKVKLPREAQNLAWLSLDEEPGIEYWISMNLAGDYASACHDVIHEKIAHALHQKPLTKIENHHNFAWKEMYKNEEVIVHRKGATPAGKGVMGIIPGSMTTNGFIVVGKGVEQSIDSASHGAGRLMSRTKAKNSISHNELQKVLKDAGVKLIGGGLDEAPHAYKDIHEVMKLQTALVDVVAKFQPVIVKMDE
jgi:tRNA-splicing ligase RtcB (3'-phosphate/5'-hydroxy nucleic acid ligase)